MADKSDLEHLAWAVEQRSEIQFTLLALYDYVTQHRPPQSDLHDRHLLNHLIGAAFSLWRAVFLADTFRDDMTIHGSQEAFLHKVIADNSINFPDDKNYRHWTVGYYLENAKMRLALASQYADHHKKTTTREQVMQHLRLIGTMGVELTRYEWESVHYALRIMLKVVHPNSDLAAVPPSAPKPKGLEAFFESNTPNS